MSITRARHVRALALVATVSLAIAACSSSGGTATAAPGGSGAPAASTAAGSTPASAAATAVAGAPAPTTGPSAADVTAPPASAAPASLDPFASLSKDKDLEARLPDSYGGVKLTKISLKGSDMPPDSKTTAYLASIGKTPADMSFAVASAAGGGPLFIALRVKGSSAEQLQQMFQLSAKQEATKVTGLKIETTNIGGIDVLKSTDPKTGEVTYFVVRGDTALGVSGKSDAEAQKAFGALAK
jgi:hypothetical protein